MSDWYANPVVWIGAITATVIVGRVVFLVGEWKGKVDTDRRDFKSFMEAIRADLSRIHARIDDIFGRLSGGVTEGASPLRLTELGKSVSEMLDAPRWAEDIARTLTHRVEGMLAYDVQEFCRSYVRDEFKPTSEQEARIKECAYEKGLDRSQVLNVLAVELRDVLLKQQPPSA